MHAYKHIVRTGIVLITFLVCMFGAAISADATETVKYYYSDAQGTPLVVTDGSANVIATYDVSPYGRSVLGSASQGIGFGGATFDSDSAFVYLQARYYDPSTGRFLSPDPIAPAPGNAFNFNRYSYGNNNPLVFSDPTGMHSASEQDFQGENCDVYKCESSQVPVGRGNVASVNCDDECQIKQDYDQTFGSKNREVQSAAKQMIDWTREAFEEATFYFSTAGIGPVEKEVEGLGVGYRSFDIFKRRFGAAGERMDWHHIVEQNTANLTRFGPYMIHNEKNLIRIDRATHEKISAFYRLNISEGLTRRQYVSGLSYKEQEAYGRMVLLRMGVNVP